MEFSVEIAKIAGYIGAGLSVGFASLSAGIGEGYTAGEATFALMKQPKANDSLTRNMLVSQAVTETGAVFSLVVALLLVFKDYTQFVGDWYSAAAFLAAGLAIGLGSIGPGFGSGYAGGQAMKAIGRMPKHNTSIMGNMLLGQALAQTDSIFALVVALLLLFPAGMPQGALPKDIIIHVSAYLSAGLAIGFGTLGPGIAIGFVSGRTNEMIGKNPFARSVLTRTMFLGAAVSESTAIYALVISMLLIYAI